MQTKQANPGWFTYAIGHRWTVRNIQSLFDVPCAIARHIQTSTVSLHQCRAISAASAELRNQVGF